MEVFVCVPMEDGVVRDVRVFRTEELANQAEKEWLKMKELEDEKERDKASDYGTGYAIWRCEVDS